MSHARSVEAVRTRAASMYWERIEVTAAYEELDETKRMAGVRTIDGERAQWILTLSSERIGREPTTDASLDLLRYFSCEIVRIAEYASPVAIAPTQVLQFLAYL